MRTAMKTTSNMSMCVACGLSVASDVKRSLQKVLIEYLWQLALCEVWKNYERQFFLLQIGELNGQGVQDLYHVCDCGNPMEGYLIYGVVPVNCTLQVLNSNGCYSMQLYEYL